MPQVKIYGLRNNIEPKRFALSHAIQAALKLVIGTPDRKRFQRFIILEPENFIFPSDRTSDYIIIEIVMFEGRSIRNKEKADPRFTAKDYGNYRYSTPRYRDYPI